MENLNTHNAGWWYNVTDNSSYGFYKSSLFFRYPDDKNITPNFDGQVILQDPRHQPSGAGKFQQLVITGEFYRFQVLAGVKRLFSST